MLQMVSIFLARVFLSLVFLLAAIDKIFNWNEAEQSLLSALCDWQTYSAIFYSIQECMVSLMPWSSLLLLLAVAIELFGSLMILFGYKEKIGALLLILLIIPVTLIFHPFWLMEGQAREIQTIMFFKNLSILGGLILLSIHGAKLKDESAHSMGY